MGVDPDKLADLLATTLKDLPSGEFETMWDSVNFEFSRLYSENRRQVDGGTSIQRNVVLDRTGRARYRRLYDTDNPRVPQVQRQIDVPWTQVTTDYSWDVLEIMRNRNSVKGFINLIESRRSESMWDYAELIEERGWKTPTNASDTLFPNGVPTYLNKANTSVTSEGDFIGQTVRYQDGTTGTSVAGLDAAVESKWRNWAFTYSTVDNQLLRRMRRSFLATGFKPPAFVRSAGNDDRGPMSKIYANLDTTTELQDLADLRDDNSGPRDLAGKMLVNTEGGTFFNRAPVAYISQLDDDADDPIYYVDWSKLIPIVQDGYWMEESKPMADRGQHSTITVYIDGAHQNLCINRRTVGWVGHKVTST